MNQLILAVDPGGTTGWALAWVNDEGIGMSSGQVPGGLLPFMRDTTEAIDLALQNGPCAFTVVIERYTIGGRTVKYSRQSDALEITGALKVYADQTGANVVIQSPSDAKSVVPDDRLKAWGWYVKGQEHARDALRHLGLYCVSKRYFKLTEGPNGSR